jgi:hypothetical protein
VYEPGDLLIEFNRIGRRSEPAALTVYVPNNAAQDPDAVAAMVHKHARRYLASQHFSVSVDLATGVVLLEAGRYGVGTIREPTAGS